MIHVQTGLAVITFLICASAFADVTPDPFQQVVTKYRATNPRPGLPEDARKFKVQAEFAVQEKEFDKAVDLYGKALEIAPWWPEGHFNRALILGETKKYWDAMREMKRYLLLVPEAPDARAAQDKIYLWEGVAGQELKPGQEFKDCPDCPEMIFLPRLFAMGKYEVTQGEWRAVMGSNPSKFNKCGDNCPVEKVSWNDAQAYIQKLNARTGKQYRLPTEAEWEYACYGGSQTELCGGNDPDAVAWHGGLFGGNSNGQTHPVGQKQANGYGLYDMSGNVWEWVEDCYDGDCDRRAFRGGSWSYESGGLGAAVRFYYVSGFRDDNIGFRVARTLP